MTITHTTPIIVGNGPSAFRGALADLPRFLDLHEIAPSSIGDVRDDEVELIVETKQHVHVLTIRGSRGSDSFRVKDVYDSTTNQTVCF